MNNVSARNWTDKQWFAFICGLVKMGDLSTPTPEPPAGIGAVLQYIFPPEFYDIDNDVRLSAYEVVIRVSDSNNVVKDYLINLQDLSMQETQVVSGITIRKPIFDHSTALYKYFRKTSGSSWSSNSFIEQAVNNKTITSIYDYTSNYTPNCILCLGNSYIIGFGNYGTHSGFTFRVNGYNEKVWTISVNNETRQIRLLTKCGDKVVIWVYNDETSPTSLEGYIFANGKIIFADGDVDDGSSLYLTGQFTNERFVVDISTMNYGIECLSANTFQYNNTKLGIISNTYYVNLINSSEAQVKFTAAQRSNVVAECQYEYDADLHNVTDGINNGLTYVDYNNNSYTLGSNQIAMRVYDIDVASNYNTYVIDIDTGSRQLCNTELLEGMWSGSWASGNYARSFLSDNVYDSVANRVYTVGTYFYRSTGTVAIEILQYNPTSVAYSYITTIRQLPSSVDLSYAFSLFKAGSMYFYGYKNSDHEIYQTYTYYDINRTTQFDLYVTYNGSRYGVYKVTQCNDDLVLWIRCSEGVVGLEFTNIALSNTSGITGTFTGYKYTINATGFVRNIQTYKNTNRLALWSYKYYYNNYTVTHFIRPQVTTDTAVITS